MNKKHIDGVYKHLWEYSNVPEYKIELLKKVIKLLEDDCKKDKKDKENLFMLMEANNEK